MINKQQRSKMLVVASLLLLFVTISLSQYINSTVIDFQDTQAVGFNSGGVEGAFDYNKMRVFLNQDTFTEYDSATTNPIFGTTMPYVFYGERKTNVAGPIGIIEVSFVFCNNFDCCAKRLLLIAERTKQSSVIIGA
jgi:hypothetical protein